MSLLSSVQPATKVIYLNTRSMYDLAIGSFEVGKSGIQHLNGGLGLITGLTGKSGTYKSTTAESFMCRAMDIYPQSEALIFDTEHNKNSLSRYVELSGNPNFDRSRIVICDSTGYDIDTFWQKVQEIADDKLKNRKDYTVESPFLDPYTGKPIIMWIPTFILIDSWSKATSSAEVNKLSTTKNLADGSLNTIYLHDSNIKTALMRQMPRMASTYGIYFILTAHMEKKVEMGMLPEPKQMQFMKQSDKIKSTGSQFNFLVTSLFQTAAAKVYVDSNKESMYPYNGSSNMEINHITGMVLRGKNQLAGLTVPLVESQYEGMLPEISYYDYLRSKENESYGFDGANIVKCKLLNSISLTRKNLRENIKNSTELGRAIEIFGEYKYIQNNWSTDRLQADFTKTDDQFVEAITKTKTSINDLLHSRSYWTYDKENKLPEMSIFDIALKLFGKRF